MVRTITHLFHSDGVSGTTIFEEDGVKAHWGEGRSSVVIIEENGTFTPVGEGDPRHYYALLVRLIDRSGYVPGRLMTSEEEASWQEAWDHYYKKTPVVRQMMFNGVVRTVIVS